MLLGESVQKLDAKNRVTLPARFRAHFAEGVVVSKGFEACLVVYSLSGWERFTGETLSGMDPFSSRGRQISRHLYAGAFQTELDRQGRVMLPASQLAHARLERDIVVAGLRDRLEIWDMTAWRALQAEFEGSVEDVAESLAQH